MCSARRRSDTDRRRPGIPLSGPDLWRRGAPGFTLLELLLAISILAFVTTVTFFTFGTVTSAWKKGMALSDDMNRGDYIVEQLVMGLRSAYFPDSRAKDATYGFWMKDDGDGPGARDEVSWVKLGASLVGVDCAFAESPHRVRFSLEEDDGGREAVAVRAWRLHGQPDDFDEKDVPPVFLARRVTGFNCRAAMETEGDEIDWLDDWEESNRIPKYVEVTLYLEPIEEGGDAVEVRRIVEPPVALLSWDDAALRQFRAANEAGIPGAGLPAPAEGGGPTVDPSSGAGGGVPAVPGAGAAPAPGTGGKITLTPFTGRRTGPTPVAPPARGAPARPPSWTPPRAPPGTPPTPPGTPPTPPGAPPTPPAPFGL